MPHRFASSPRRRRSAVAAVEFAVCLPVIILLMYGSIEASSYIFLKQSLNAAAYEGAREAIRPGSDNTQGIERATTILHSRNVREFTIQFPEGDPATVPRGDPIVIQISASTKNNRPLSGQFMPDRKITSRVVMVKE